MGLVIATEGKSHQTKTYTHCRWYVEDNGSRMGASNNKKLTNESAVGLGSNNLPNQLAIQVLKKHRNWYKSLSRTQKDD
jgi:hypothetical protein